MTTPIDNRDFAGIMTTPSPGRTNCLIHAGGGALNDHSHREHRRHHAEGLLVQGNTGRRFPYSDQSEWWQVHHPTERYLPGHGRVEWVERVCCANSADRLEFVLPCADSSRCRFSRPGADRRDGDSRIGRRHRPHPLFSNDHRRGTLGKQRARKGDHHSARCERLAMLGVAA